MRSLEREPIDLDDPEHQAFWCARLGVDSIRLREVVETVGPMPAAVQTYLQAKGGPPREVTDAMRADFTLQAATRRARRRK